MLKVKKTMAVLLLVLFAVSSVAMSVSARGDDGPKGFPADHHDNHFKFVNNHIWWMDGNNQYRYDGHYWWDDKHQWRWDGNYWWDKDGRRWDKGDNKWY
jgi:hypothetical protein